MADRTSWIAACIDITGSRRSMDIVLMGDEATVEHHFARSDDALLKILKEYGPRIVAIDGPSGQNKGRTRDKRVRGEYGWTDKFSDRQEPDGSAMPLYGNMRLCEAMLIARGIGAYSTLPDVAKAATWIQRGWRLYSRLTTELGYELWAKPGPVAIGSQRTVIEVHPYACFVVGLGWKPAPKDSIGGQLERIAYLLDSLTWQEQPLHGSCLPTASILPDFCRCLREATWESIRTKGLKIPALTHDLIDCLGGLTSILGCLAGAAYALGDPAEGVIVLPSEPKPLNNPYRGPREERI